MKPSPQLSIVLPCYNESRGLESILRRFAEVGAGADFELILVDNGSTDNTAETLQSLLPAYPFARGVRVAVNQGYGHGLHTGLQAARGEVLAWSHADLQTDPADVFRAWAIYCKADHPRRTLVKGMRHGRRMGERIISTGMGLIASVLFRMRLSEINAQPKVFHRGLLEHAPNPPIDFNFDVYMLVAARRAGWRIETLLVKFPPRQYGHSNWARTWKSKVRTIWRSFRYMARLALTPHSPTPSASSPETPSRRGEGAAPHPVKRPHLLDKSRRNIGA